jgi:hypothetical protein
LATAGGTDLAYRPTLFAPKLAFSGSLRQMSRRTSRASRGRARRAAATSGRARRPRALETVEDPRDAEREHHAPVPARPGETVETLRDGGGGHAQGACNAEARGTIWAPILHADHVRDPGSDGRAIATHARRAAENANAAETAMQPGWIEPLLATLAGYAVVAVPWFVYARFVRPLAARVSPAELPALRLRLYRAARALVDGMLERGECDLPALEELDRSAWRADVVFDGDSATYLAELRDRTLEALRMRSIIVNPGPVAFRPEAKARWTELMKWFALQPAQLERRLAPFLAAGRA